MMYGRVNLAQANRRRHDLQTRRIYTTDYDAKFQETG
jgi:hypothetical protein